jgi:hypothetical protein
MDMRLGITRCSRRQGAVLKVGETSLPVYGELLTLIASYRGTACVAAGTEIAGVRVEMEGATVIRLGYDLFDEVRHLLSTGQPVKYAAIPTLEIHIRMLREWMLAAGVSFFEIPPAPAGRDFFVCLTHDIDFIGIRQHLLDHSMWGFLYRATVGSLCSFLRGRLAFSRLVRCWLAAATLPMVYLRLMEDYWEPFAWYLRVEKGLPTTYFLIPFKRRIGEKVPGRNAARRATAYDVTDMPRWTQVLQAEGCELGVHGLDGWHSVEKGRAELRRVTKVTGKSTAGIRMHWLLQDEQTPGVLEQAGYDYDSTCGYNETVGYKAGTGQVFRPLNAQTLLELPVHIQDGALFYPQRLHLTEAEATTRCETLIDDAGRFGGVLTLLWHDRSHGPERFWGGFYARLVEQLKSLNTSFGSAAEVVSWFRSRRSVRFETVETPTGTRLRLTAGGDKVQPPLRVRIYGRAGQGGADFVDLPWDGKSSSEFELSPEIVPSHSHEIGLSGSSKRL